MPADMCIPDALHLCPRCGELANGPTLCPGCVLFAQYQSDRKRHRERRRRIERALICYALLAGTYFFWRGMVGLMVWLCTAAAGRM
jgi:hypothetical protein